MGLVYSVLAGYIVFTRVKACKKALKQVFSKMTTDLQKCYLSK